QVLGSFGAGVRRRAWVRSAPRMAPSLSSLVPDPSSLMTRPSPLISRPSPLLRACADVPGQPVLVDRGPVTGAARRRARLRLAWSPAVTSLSAGLTPPATSLATIPHRRAGPDRVDTPRSSPPRHVSTPGDAAWSLPLHHLGKSPCSSLSAKNFPGRCPA